VRSPDILASPAFPKLAVAKRTRKTARRLVFSQDKLLTLR
jgi:hypothetical protein